MLGTNSTPKQLTELGLQAKIGDIAFHSDGVSTYVITPGATAHFVASMETIAEAALTWDTRCIGEVVAQKARAAPYLPHIYDPARYVPGHLYRGVFWLGGLPFHYYTKEGPPRGRS